MGMSDAQLLLLIGICWVPVVILGILGFATLLRRDGRTSAMSAATVPPVRLGTIELAEGDQTRELELQWVNGAFVAGDGRSVMPTMIAELDTQGRVHWASEQQRWWFRERFAEGT